MVTAEQLLNHAALLQHAGKIDDAASLIRQVANENPSHLGATMSLGAIEMVQHHFEAAVTAYQHLIQLAPKDATAHLKLASALRSLNENAQAVIALERAVHLDPQSVPALLHLAETLIHLSRQNDAANILLQALAIDPNCADAHGHLGSAYADLSRTDEATAALRRATELAPDNSQWRSRLNGLNGNGN